MHDHSHQQETIADLESWVRVLEDETHCDNEG